MAIIQNGFSNNTMAASSTLTPPATIWLYDTATGNNVVTVNGQQQEYLNISQFPIQNGNWS